VAAVEILICNILLFEEDRKWFKAGKHPARTCVHLQVVIEDFY